MSDAATSPGDERQFLPVLGTFVVGPRVIDASRRLGATVLVEVSGRAETPQAGREGLAYCSLIEAGDSAALAGVAERLSRLTELRHATIATIIETGFAGRAAYIVEARMAGARLADRLAEGPIPVWQVASLLGQIAAALQFAHDHHLNHGAISPMTVWIDAPVGARLGGFSATGGSESKDQTDLAALAFEMIAARPWSHPGDASSSGVALLDRVRGSVHGLSERLADVIARGLDPRPTEQFSSVQEFGASFASVVAESAQEIGAGAWEAISRQDFGMATILTKLLGAYDPRSSEIALLNHRLTGASPQDANAFHGTSLLERRAVAPRPALDSSTAAPTSGDLGFTEAELRRMFGGEIDQTVSRGNPWIIVLAVLFGLITVTAIVVAIALSPS